MAEPVANLDEIRALSAHLPSPDIEAGTLAASRQAQLTKPAGALGRLEELAIWLATWQARHPPRIDHPRTLVFAGNHGVAARGVSAYPAAVTAQMVQNFISGGAAINQLCRVFDVGLKVYEMNLDTPTADIVVEPAMSEEECAKAMAYGMMAVEPGIDVLALGEMGIGNTTAAAALCGGLFGGDAEMWTGPGTGVAGAAFAAKRQVVDEALAAPSTERPATRSTCCAGWAGSNSPPSPGPSWRRGSAECPSCSTASPRPLPLRCLYAADQHALDHCVVGHVSAEPGHRRLIERIHQRPLFDFGMRLGEGSGATLALAVLKAAVACHNGMATFAEASVSGPS